MTNPLYDELDQLKAENEELKKDVNRLVTAIPTLTDSIVDILGIEIRDGLKWRGRE